MNKLLFWRNLPGWKYKNIRIYYLLTILNNCWFIEANWIFFWIRFMTLGQLGLIDSTAFAFGLLAEVPSGAVSDLIGKKKTIIWAMALASISFLTIGLTNSRYIIWGFFLLAQMGWALYSGSAEALAYDTLKDEKDEELYEKVSSSCGAVANISNITAIALGGLLYAWNFRSTHLALGITYSLAMIGAFFLVEPKNDSESFSVRVYVDQLKTGVKEIFQKKLLAFIPIIFSVLGVYYLYDWGLTKPVMAINFGFNDKAMAVILPMLGILGAVTVSKLPKIRKVFGDIKGLYLLSTIMGVAFIIAAFPLGVFGLLPMAMIRFSASLTTPWISIIFNKYISSKYRATSLSAIALLTKLPYVLLAVVVGYMSEIKLFWLFCAILGIGLVGLTSFSYLNEKHKNIV